MLRTILIDDEKSALNNLERILKQYEQIEIIEVYTDVTEAFDKFKKEKVHLVFLDIEMPKMKGIEAAEKIQGIDNDVQIVFVTAYSDYAVDAFEVEAVDYVMKPIIKRRLDKTIEKVLKMHSRISQEKEIDNEVEISCFGNFEIRSGQEKIKWRTSKSEELCAYLVHHRGEFIHKSKIMEELWPEKDREQAIKLLHTTVYYTRSGLKSINLEKEIIHSNKMYKFDLELKRCDIEEFDKAFKSRDAITSENVNILEKAIQLYGGEYLEGNDYCWATGRQIHYGDMYREMVTKISDIYIGEKNYSRAIPHLKAILEKEPYAEETHRKLMNAYMNIGDYANFKQHYRIMENDFKVELDLELDEKTKELYREGIAKIEKQI